MKKRICGLILILLLLTGLIVGSIGFGLAEPRSSLGHIVFHVGYSIPASRPSFLSLYQWAIKKGEGGYFPSSVDQFLINRLWECEGTAEFDAIIDFHIRQNSSRWGDAPAEAHETLRIQIIVSIIPRLDNMTHYEAVSAMVLMESLRRGEPIHKGGFSGLHTWNHSRDSMILDQNKFSLAKQKFAEWWASERLTPKQKMMIDPLSATEFKIYDGP
ncbi:MAG: hypothetical protein AAF571_14175 [Verrucomicrobiota bacterium]